MNIVVLFGACFGETHFVSCILHTKTDLRTTMPGILFLATPFPSLSLPLFLTYTHTRAREYIRKTFEIRQAYGAVKGPRDA